MTTFRVVEEETTFRIQVSPAGTSRASYNLPLEGKEGREVEELGSLYLGCFPDPLGPSEARGLLQELRGLA